MHHRLPQIFCGRLPSPMALGNVVCRAVAVDYRRVIHRKIRSLLLKLPNRISACLDHVGYQMVGECNRSSRIVHKPGLHLAPPTGVTRFTFRRQRMNLELLSPSGAKFQHSFSLPDVFSCANTRPYSGPKRCRSFSLRLLRQKAKANSTTRTATTTMTMVSWFIPIWTPLCRYGMRLESQLLSRLF